MAKEKTPTVSDDYARIFAEELGYDQDDETPEEQEAEQAPAEPEPVAEPEPEPEVQAESEPAPAIDVPTPMSEQDQMAERFKAMQEALYHQQRQTDELRQRLAEQSKAEPEEDPLERLSAMKAEDSADLDSLREFVQSNYAEHEQLIKYIEAVADRKAQERASQYVPQLAEQVRAVREQNQAFAKRSADQALQRKQYIVQSKVGDLTRYTTHPEWQNFLSEQVNVRFSDGQTRVMPRREYLTHTFLNADETQMDTVADVYNQFAQAYNTNPEPKPDAKTPPVSVPTRAGTGTGYPPTGKPSRDPEQELDGLLQKTRNRELSYEDSVRANLRLIS